VARDWMWRQSQSAAGARRDGKERGSIGRRVRGKCAPIERKDEHQRRRTVRRQLLETEHLFSTSVLIKRRLASHFLAGSGGAGL
jgi:hypothetical protein